MCDRRTTSIPVPRTSVPNGRLDRPERFTTLRNIVLAAAAWRPVISRRAQIFVAVNRGDAKGNPLDWRTVNQA
jgi:hypothetical protein